MVELGLWKCDKLSPSLRGMAVLYLRKLGLDLVVVVVVLVARCCMSSSNLRNEMSHVFFGLFLILNLPWILQSKIGTQVPFFTY